MRQLLLATGLILTSAFCKAHYLPLDKPLRICGDGAGWPPYTYQADNQVKGYDLDVLHAILDPLGIKFSVAMPPWKRCLADTEKGSYQIALSASRSKERARRFILTRDYYTLTAKYYFATRKKLPSIKVALPGNLLKYKACGLRGYNYDGFGVPSELLDRDANDFPQVIRKTKAGRCDLFLARYEILRGFELVGKRYLDNSLGYGTIPGIEGDKFYMLISRAYPHAEQLKALLNKGIERLEQQGQLRKFLSKYPGFEQQ